MATPKINSAVDEYGYASAHDKKVHHRRSADASMGLLSNGIPLMTRFIMLGMLLLFVVGCAPANASLKAQPGEHVVPVSRRGGFRFGLPPEWTFSVANEKPGMTTVKIVPREGDDFEANLWVAEIDVSDPSLPLVKEEDVKGLAYYLGATVVAESKMSAFELRKAKLRDSYLYYFKVDRSSQAGNKGETQCSFGGISGVSDLRITIDFKFNVFSEEKFKQLLAVLLNAKSVRI